MDHDPSDSPPAVSVLMVVRRPEPGSFAAAIDSVLAQSLGDLELVVVETASEIDAAPVLAVRRDPRVRHVSEPAGTPLARARNRALREARAALVAILDADDVAEPERLARQRAFLATHPDIDVVGSALRLIRADGSALGVRCYPEDDAAIRRAMRRYNPIAQPAVMARRSAIDAVGGYAERPGGVCEDYELWCRMARAGARFANLREPLVRYRIHPGSMKSAQLRGTLRDTIAIKRACFGGELDLGDRLRILGERMLGLLPNSLVRRLFLESTLERTREDA